jgi:hypothetical protein
MSGHLSASVALRNVRPVELTKVIHKQGHRDMISGFRSDFYKICALLRYYAASCGNCLSTFRDNVSISSSRVNSLLLTFEDGTDTLSRNVGKQLPHDAA